MIWQRICVTRIRILDRRVIFIFLAAICAALITGRGVRAAEDWDPRAGFPGWDEVCRRVEALGQASSYCRVTSLGKTLGDRPIWLIKLGSGRTENKPAVLIVAGGDAEQFSSSAVALSLVDRLIADAKSGGRWKSLLSRYTVYVVPVASPDAYAAMWEDPMWERNRNSRPWDEDGDGRVDEDGPEDLDGDGRILSMRIVDPEGEWVQHPQDARVLVPFEPADVGRTRYRVVSEGIDNDHDGLVNEDPAGGTAFNRNFPFEYPFFAADAGPWQVSEPETQAAADLLLHQGNIAAVVVLGTCDNMLKPWTPDPSAESAAVKKRILATDATYFDPIAKFYREVTGFSDEVESRPEGGSFPAWAYFHGGCWSFAARTWVPTPSPRPEDGESDADTDRKADDCEEAQPAGTPQSGEAQTADSPRRGEGDSAETQRVESVDKRNAEEDKDKRGRYQRTTLAFWEARGVRAFVNWHRFDHPDFPGRRVEIGGFIPASQWNPPPALVEDLAEKHERFVARILEALPRLRIARSDLEALGGGLFRLTVEVQNVGQWPTMPKMGEINRQPYPVRVELGGEGWELVQGFRKTLLKPLPGNGGREELRWILRHREEVARLRVQVTAAAPQVGKATKTLELPAE